MSTVTVKTPDGTGTYGQINTDDYIFNNFPSGSGTITLDPAVYEFVKIDNIYYKNDGRK